MSNKVDCFSNRLTVLMKKLKNQLLQHLNLTKRTKNIKYKHYKV